MTFVKAKTDKAGGGSSAAGDVGFFFEADRS